MMDRFLFQGTPGGAIRPALALATALALGACASTPAPTAALDAAHLAISDAERGEAGKFAAGDLADARSKLEQADSAVASKQMPQAERFANEARVDAELAQARTADVKAKTVNADMQRSNGNLIDELQRNSGDNR